MTDTKSIVPKAERRDSVGARHSQLSADEAVAAAAQKRFSESSYAALRWVACEYHEGMFVLRGTVPSFHMKQLAQELVRKIEGVGAVVNALEVER